MRAAFVAIVMTIGLMSGFLGVPTATAANTYLTNPLGFAYQSADGATYAKQRYSQPTGMVVTGRCNRYDQGFADARAAGAEILAYLDAAERPDGPICALDTGFYGGDLSRTPLWPYPTYGQRVNYPNHHMTDMRAGSPWVLSVVAYIENLMREDRVDGVFLDVVGTRTWSTSSAWTTWPQIEKDRWAAGNVDLVRRLDASRRAINPRFIIVNNNVWDINADTPPGALDGEQYVDGICLELNPISAYTRRVAGKPYGNLGHRRVLVIANSTTDPQDWTDVQGVTHVSDQFDYYGIPSPPPVGFNRLTDRPKRFGRTDIAASSTGGLTAHQKRGSKFTGDTEGVIRLRGDGPDNWYASIDQFADGPANPFGTGWSGPRTLSLNVFYTVGH